MRTVSHVRRSTFSMRPREEISTKEIADNRRAERACVAARGGQPTDRPHAPNTALSTWPGALHCSGTRRPIRRPSLQWNPSPNTAPFTWCSGRRRPIRRPSRDAVDPVAQYGALHVVHWTPSPNTALFSWCIGPRRPIRRPSRGAVEPVAQNGALHVVQWIPSPAPSRRGIG